MVQNQVDNPRSNPDAEGRALGPADGVLFDTLDTRLSDMELYRDLDNRLFATTPDTSSAVRLAVTDYGLVATEIFEQESVEENLTPVEHIDPAPAPNVATDSDLRTRLRGD